MVPRAEPGWRAWCAASPMTTTCSCTGTTTCSCHAYNVYSSTGTTCHVAIQTCPVIQTCPSRQHPASQCSCSFHTPWVSHRLGFTPLRLHTSWLHIPWASHHSWASHLSWPHRGTCICTHAHARMHMHARPCTHAHARTPMHARISLGARAEPLRGWCARRESRQEAGRLHPPAPSAQAGRAPRAYR